MVKLVDTPVLETGLKCLQVRILLSAQLFLLVQRIEFLATDQAMGVRVAQRKLIVDRMRDKFAGNDHIDFLY